jgi:hypothetical protein
MNGTGIVAFEIKKGSFNQHTFSSFIKTYLLEDGIVRQRIVAQDCSGTHQGSGNIQLRFTPPRTVRGLILRNLLFGLKRVSSYARGYRIRRHFERRHPYSLQCDNRENVWRFRPFIATFRTTKWRLKLGYTMYGIEPWRPK